MLVISFLGDTREGGARNVTSSRGGIAQEDCDNADIPRVASLRCGVSLFEFRLLSRSSTQPPPLPPPSSRRLVVLGAPHALLRRLECSGCAAAAAAAGVDLSRFSSRARRIVKHTQPRTHVYTRAHTACVPRVFFVAFFSSLPPRRCRRSRGIREVTRLHSPC